MQDMGYDSITLFNNGEASAKVLCAVLGSAF